MSVSNLHLTIDVKKYMSILYVFAFFFIIAHASLYFYHYHFESLPRLLLQMFDLDQENNLPTWFSGFILLNVAFFLFAYSRTENLEKKPYWLILSVGFLALAIDEVAGIHETINSVTDINWAIPAGILLFVLAAAFVPFLFSLRRGLALLFLLSGLMYVSGAIVVELASEHNNSDSMVYKMHVAIEEALEMLGVLLFLAVNLNEFSEDKPLHVDLSVKEN